MKLTDLSLLPSNDTERLVKSKQQPFGVTLCYLAAARNWLLNARNAATAEQEAQRTRGEGCPDFAGEIVRAEFELNKLEAHISRVSQQIEERRHE